ncbi:MAG: T9SS type A sorting domain-containing protein, partial [Chitinophagales bacterium]
VADIDCINKDTCIAIHGTPYCCDGGWEFGIYKTTNGCETWEVVGYFTDGLDVQFVSESAIYILGLFFISKSTDGVITWEVIKEEAFTGSTFSSMKFLNDTVGYLTEWKYPENYIYFTDDGGETWIENTIDSMPAGKISAIDCLNADSCFFGSSRKLYRNFSDGVTIMQNGNTSINILDIFPNPATDILHLKLSVRENNYTIQTLNVIDELIELNFLNNQAEISHLPPGIYFTEVITEHG